MDFLLFSIFCLLILLIITFHPSLSSRYNISRIYLQLLPFLSLSVIVGINIPLQYLNSKISNILNSIFFTILFLFLHGALVPIIGGIPNLLFYNTGTDFEKFYVYKGELVSAKWLGENRNYTSTVYGDYFSGLKLRREAQLFPNTEIIPEVIANNMDSYVYLSATNKISEKTQVNFMNKFLTYTYPKDILEDEKNLIYSNKTSSIYK